MKTVGAVKEYIQRLVRAHGNKEEVMHQTALIEHDDRYGNRLPEDVVKARAVERWRDLRQGGLRLGHEGTDRHDTVGEDRTCHIHAVLTGPGVLEYHRPTHPIRPDSHADHGFA